MERSVIFTSLLDLSPEFGKLPRRDGERIVTKAHEAWKASSATDMHAFVRSWLAKNPIR